MLEYKGFIGTAEYDEENQVFTGLVENTRVVIAFHGENEEELEMEFRKSVDEYLTWCEEMKET